MTAHDGTAAADEGSLAAHPALLGHIFSSKELGRLIRCPDRAKHQSEWRDSIRELTRLPPSSAQLAEHFHTQ
jgi:hypothetical protein